MYQEKVHKMKGHARNICVPGHFETSLNILVVVVVVAAVVVVVFRRGSGVVLMI